MSAATPPTLDCGLHRPFWKTKQNKTRQKSKQNKQKKTPPLCRLFLWNIQSNVWVYILCGNHQNKLLVELFLVMTSLHLPALRKTVIPPLCLPVSLILPSKEISFKIVLPENTESGTMASFLIISMCVLPALSRSSLNIRVFVPWIVYLLWNSNVLLLEIVLKLILLNRVQAMRATPIGFRIQFYDSLSHLLIIRVLTDLQLLRLADSTWED